MLRLVSSGYLDYLSVEKYERLSGRPERPWPSGVEDPGVPRVTLKLCSCAGGYTTFCLVCTCVNEFVCKRERSVWQERGTQRG